MVTARQKAERWVNASALMAKLYHAGLLDDYGPLWVVGDFETGFMRHTYGDLATNVGRQSEVLVPANHILLAGDMLVKEFQGPSKVRGSKLDAATWVSWASKLQEVADAVGEDAPWDLKKRAQEAHDKMVVLHPEAFKEGQSS